MNPKIRLSEIISAVGEWKNLSVNRKIFSASLSIALLTLVVGLFSMAKEIVVAYSFGTAGELDAFLIAFLLPSFAVGVAANSLPAALIPTYIEVRERKGRDESSKLLIGVFARFLLFLITLSIGFGVILYFFIPIAYSGFSDEIIDLTRKLFLIILPFLFINGLSKLFASVLNAEEDFALPGISPVFMPLFMIVFMVLFQNLIGIRVLAYGVVSGAFVELSILAYRVKRKNIFPPVMHISKMPEIRTVAGQYYPMVLGMLMVSGMPLVDQSMASMLGEGNVSVYNYGSRIVSFFLGLATVSLGTAVFPHFSRMVSENNREGILHTFSTYRRLIFSGGAVFAVCVFWFSDDIVRIIFQRGAFTAEDTISVGLVQAFLALQTPFYIGQILIVRLLSAFKNNMVLMWVSLNTLVLNIVFNYIFMRVYGVAGIALSTAMVGLIMYVLLDYIKNIKLRRVFV